MLKISEFSKLTQLPAKTLRYYDEIGLLKPAQIDPWTGYRYYSVEQLPRLNRILALKALGLSLSQIGQLLDDALSAEEIRGMLRLKRAEIQQQLEDEQARLAYVEAKLRQIEREGKMSDYEVILKKVEPVRVASMRTCAPTLAEIGATINRMFEALGGYVYQQRGGFAGAGMTLYRDAEYMETNIDVEAVLPISGELSDSGDITICTLPGAETMACTVHRGNFDQVGEAYTALLRWIEEHGYHIVGPNREVYLQYDRNGDPAAWVTEIQFPVEKL